MGRNLTLRAVILRNYRIGEIHKGIVLFTDSAGLVSAIAHGALSPKGRLRGVTDPFCTGYAYLYHDPVKDSYKVTDFDVRSYFSGLRDSVTRYYTANLWAEVILKSHGGGVSSKELFSLFFNALTALDDADDRAAKRVSAAYLWRYLDLVGSAPSVEACAECGRAFDDRYRANLAYDRAGGGLVCDHCADATAERMVLTPGAVRYLLHTAGLSYAAAAEIDIDDASMKSLLAFVYHLVGELVEAPLNTLEIGGNILW